MYTMCWFLTFTIIIIIIIISVIIIINNNFSYAENSSNKSAMNLFQNKNSSLAS